MATQVAGTADKRFPGGNPNYDIVSFAIDFLHGIGAPTTPGNIQAVVGWANAESSGYNPSRAGGRNNPLNIVATANDGHVGQGGSQGNIADFATPQAGAAATARFFNDTPGAKANIVQAFRSDAGVGAIQTVVNQFYGQWGGSITFAGPQGASGKPQASYANPFRDVKNLSPERIDQGVDYGGTGPVYAIGNAVVENVTASGWPGGTFIQYKLLDGPAAGMHVYLAEDVHPNVTVGQLVNANTVLGTMYGGPHGIETGWADPNPGTQRALGASQWREGGNSTADGVNFNGLLTALGAPGGKQHGISGTFNGPAQLESWQSLAGSLFGLPGGVIGGLAGGAGALNSATGGLTGAIFQPFIDFIKQEAIVSLEVVGGVVFIILGVVIILVSSGALKDVPVPIPV
jgi:hypothetical protein